MNSFLKAGMLAVTAVTAMGAGGVASAAGKKSDGKAGPTLKLTAEHSDFSRGRGTKSLVGATAGLPIGSGSQLTVSLGAGEARSGGKVERARSIGATLEHRFGQNIVSRTSLSNGEAGALFAGLGVGEELAFKLGANDLRTAVRMTRYTGGHDVQSYHAGLARTVGPFRLDYGVGAYARSGPIPRGFIHRGELTLGDRSGSTSLVVGAGSSLHEHYWRSDKVAGTFRSVSVKRKHTLFSQVAVEVGAGWTGYERSSGRFQSVKLGGGLILYR